MLKADSSTLKRESDVQPMKRPPMIPSAVACVCTERTTFKMPSIELVGNALISSVTRKLDSSARPAKPRSASARNRSGTNERSAKYAIIAARWVPRSAKNLLTTRLTCGSMLGAMDAAQAIADLTEISPQIREVAIVDAKGSLVGSNAPDR